MGKIRMCGSCRHYATTDGNKRKGACMAFLKQVDGHWEYHPERESNRYACGLYEDKEEKDER